MAKSFKRLAISAWLPVVLWMGVIFFASTDLGSADHTSRVIEPLVRWVKPDASSEQIDFVHFVVRKTAHLTEYAILAILILRALRLTATQSAGRLSYRLLGLALVIAAIYAAGDEFHQSFVGGRTPSAHDVLIDTTGAFIGLVIACLTRIPGNKGQNNPAPETATVGK